AVSKPEVFPRHPVAGGSLSLRCVVHQGSLPSTTWLRGRELRGEPHSDRGDDGPSTQHYIYWSPVLIILMLIVIACLIIYHRHKGRRQEAAQEDSSPSPPPPPEDEYEALGQRENVYDSLDPSQVQTTNFSSKTRPWRGQGATRVHHPRGGRKASDQYENLPPEHEYEALGHREVLYDSLEPTRVQGRGKWGRKEPGHPSRRTSDFSKM
ncbi:uncharacterized protein LOC133339744, partial [Lethenteron reissneri]|uniref:uncharacterized protein LOC133339744 n=1 Tax=Lethenteron reissneri TaxID=7753 RepID=UPI002AB6CA62